MTLGASHFVTQVLFQTYIPDGTLDFTQRTGSTMMKENIESAAGNADRRRERRFQPHQDAMLKASGWRPGPIMKASVLDISGSGMRLRTPLPVPCGTPVEIHTNETLTCGSVCRCKPDNVSYTLGVQLSNTLSSQGGKVRR